MDSESSSESNVSYEEDCDDEVYDRNTKKDEYDQKTVEFPFEVLTPDDVVQCMNDTIENVTSIIKISSTTARVLLNHTKWNRELLMERLFGDNSDKLYKEAKIPYPLDQEETNQKKTCNREENQECEICCIETLGSNFLSLRCGHTFCSNCWSQYLEVKILGEGMANIISCPKHMCSVLLDQKTCLTVLQNPRARQTYLKLITKNFVESNPVLKWCPNRECSYAIKVEYVLMRPVTCHCGTIFCFKCANNWHSPLKCDMLKKWIKKFEDDSETSNWLAANTQDCPKCKLSIEKNGGCNHMTCKNCTYEFCWICDQDWKLHDISFECMRYIADVRQARKDTASRAREALNRYIFYRDRYVNHKNSLELEQQLISDVRDKVEELHKSGVSITQTPILEDAVQVLNRCRRTLMYTYPFSFYLEDNNEAHIFRDNQADLQRATENLSGYLEHNMDQETLDELIHKILHLRKYCIDRCNVLESHVEEGYENNTWKYINYD